MSNSTKKSSEKALPEDPVSSKVISVDPVSSKVISVDPVSQNNPSEVTKKLIGKKIVIDWKKTIMKPLNPADLPLKRPSPPPIESQVPKKRAKKMIVPMRSTQQAEITQEPEKAANEDDDDEVIVLPPELPIDIDALPDVAEAAKKDSTGLNLLKCEFCNAVSNKRETLDEHIRLSHNSPCVLCKMTFSSEILLSEHVAMRHKAIGTKKRKQALEPKTVEDGGFRMSARNYGRHSRTDELYNIITSERVEKTKRILAKSRAAQ